VALVVVVVVASVRVPTGSVGDAAWPVSAFLFVCFWVCFRFTGSVSPMLDSAAFSGGAPRARGRPMRIRRREADDQTNERLGMIECVGSW
jgi:hypothetical protein